MLIYPLLNQQMTVQYRDRPTNTHGHANNREKRSFLRLQLLSWFIIFTTNQAIF
uniref:Uncharacterized protein n=1 Tax=Anguilla anguilla TaxID=7936 RepID=A0A0E9UN80_ANGAN